MIYSVRQTTTKHGDANFHILLYIIVITSLLVWYFGKNYLIIFLSSGAVHFIIESLLTITGIRKGRTFLFGKQLPRLAEISLRSLVEGPAFCVPAYFIADQIKNGNLVIIAIFGAIIVGLASLYSALSDNYFVKKHMNTDKIITSRRAMSKPKAFITLLVINSFFLFLIFRLPNVAFEHATMYLVSYACFVLLFYFINYNLGVRYIEMYDSKKDEYFKPGVFYQAVGLFYDSVFEMTLFISPAYLIPYYLGLFN
ncbi:MAG: hypothetical protein ACKO7D_07505 [Bacteroidota bacterium]